MNHQQLTEEQAIAQILQRMNEFKSKFGKKALEASIHNGAFHVHPAYGDLTYVFQYREFNHELIEVPLWVTDMFRSADDLVEEPLID